MENPKFFDWLRENNQLDRYEAALDISEDYVGNQKYRLDASEFVSKMKKGFANYNKMNSVERDYRIAERADEAIKEHGSIESAISAIKIDLNDYESSWSKYSGDGLGHAITCNRLLLSWLKREKNDKSRKN